MTEPKGMIDGVWVFGKASIANRIKTGAWRLSTLNHWIVRNRKGPVSGALQSSEDVEGVQGGERQIDSHEPG